MKNSSFQEIILKLQDFWASHGCLITQPYYTQVGAGTMNPATFLRVLGPEHVPEYAALNSTISGFRGLLGPFLGSVLISLGRDYPAVFALSAGLTLAGAVMLTKMGISR